MEHQPQDATYEARVRDSFARQAFMTMLGAQLTRVAPGEVVIELPYREDLTQQHGFLHAGAVTSVVDSACGYAALTLMAPGSAVLSVEFKVNLTAPAAGTRFQAIGRVLRAGRTLTVCTGEMHALRDDGTESVVAVMQATMMALHDRAGLRD